MGSADMEERRAWFGREVLPLHGRLSSYARKFCSSGEDEPDDLVSETFVRIIAYENWRNVNCATAFACRILKNLALDGYRRRTLAAVDFVSDLNELGVVDDRPGPEMITVDRDEIKRLDRVLDGLPSNIRQAVLLRKLHGLSHREIADHLGLSVSTVEKHLAKGLRVCSEKLGRRTVKIGTPAQTYSTPAWAGTAARSG